MKGTGALILGYHRVAERVLDPFGLCVGPANFAAQLDELMRRFEPSTLDNVLEPSARRRFVVTLDDGYADNLWHALPVARAKGVPLTVFVTSGMLDRPQGMWWDRLAALVARRPRSARSVELALPRGTESVALQGRDGDDLRALHRRLLPLPTADIDRLLSEISAQWSVSSAAPEDARPLTSEELLELGGDELVTVGAHTTEHLRLSGQPDTEQRRQIGGSKGDLERRLGRPVAHFAYPFGDAAAFDDASVAAARDAGFDTASTCLVGTVDASTDRLRLPRRVVGNWGRLRFRAQMLRWDLW